jgi:hypothetical protein
MAFIYIFIRCSHHQEQGLKFGFGIEAQFENLTPGPWESVDPVHKII